jgi:hypothetical protein
LDPQPVPKVQWLELTSVPEPDARTRAVAGALVASANGEPLDVSLGRLDRAGMERDLVFVRTLFGPTRLGRPIAADGSSTTFRVIGERGALDLALSIDPEGRLETTRWTPCAVRPPLFDVR